MRTSWQRAHASEYHLTVATSLAQHLLNHYGIEVNEYFAFMDMSLGWTQYVTLLERKAFKISDNLILLDADVPAKPDFKGHKKDILEGSDNVVFLPLLVGEGLFELLSDAERYRIFYTEFASNSSFTREVCFNDWLEGAEWYRKNNRKSTIKA